MAAAHAACVRLPSKRWAPARCAPSCRLGLQHPVVRRRYEPDNDPHHARHPGGWEPPPACLRRWVGCEGQGSRGWLPNHLPMLLQSPPCLSLPPCADLNGFLLQMEDNIAAFAGELGCTKVEQQYSQLADSRWAGRR